MLFLIDIDGVITSNPSFFQWFIYTLRKKENKHKVHIVSCRNPERIFETELELTSWGIKYDEIHYMQPELPRDLKTQAEWKIAIAKFIKPDIWIDNDFKIYKQTCGVDVWKELPDVTKIMI
jgi:hypothetical protein